jgi:hypothetical protein
MKLVPESSSGELVQRRSTEFLVQVLDQYQNLKFTLEGMSVGGSLQWSAYASIKGSGQFTVTDTGQAIDWLNDRLLVQAITVDNEAEPVTTDLGLFLCAAPTAKWDAAHRVWSVELLDKLSILDSDVVTTSSGNAETYSVHAGDNPITKVKDIIADAGESSSSIRDDDDARVSTDTTWDAGTTRLKIINDLLSSANYFSLWCDGQGEYRAIKYQAPNERSPEYVTSSPFVEGYRALFSPSWEHDEDIYDVPNRYILIQMGTEDKAGLSSVATNEHGDRFSFEARGRWITKTETGVEATSQASLDAQAQQKLDVAQSVTSKMNVEHVYLPGLLVNSVVNFSAGKLGYILATVSKTEIPLDPLKLVKTTLRKVVS